MMEWRLTALAVLLLLTSACAETAKRPSRASGAHASASDDGFDEELGGDDKPATADTSEPTPSPVVGEVESRDIKKLAEAKKSKSEAAILKSVAEILGKDANHAQALNTLGVHYFEAKKYGLAKIIFKRALKEHPSEPALHNNLGIVYLAEGDVSLALEAFKKSVQVKNGYRVGATNLSSIYVEYRDYKKSLAPLEASYEDQRSDLRRGQESAVEVANNYAVALMGTGDQSKARKVFDEIVSSSTRQPAPFLNYAILLVEVLKEKKDAIRIISKLKFITDDREILRRVGELEKKLE